ncbi:MAG: extracellular solute-binding protein [Patescibacteria group bacterium]
MFKKVLLIFLASVFITAGFGCKTASPEEQAAAKPVTLEYWTVFDDVDALKSLIAKFKIDHPQITVNLRQLRYEELYPLLVEELAEDKGPDIISVRNRWMKEFQTKLASMPASAKIARTTIEKGMVGEKAIISMETQSLPTVSQIDKEYVSAVKNDVVIDGKAYGLPLSFDTMAVYFNKDLLDRAGVAETPTSWEDFQAAVKKITKYNKTTGKIIQSGAALGTGNNIPSAEDILYILFKQSGLNFTDSSGKAIFNSVTQFSAGGESPAMGVMNFYSDFANSTRDTYTWNEEMGNALDRFVNGSVAFFFGYQHQYSVIKGLAPQLNFGIIPMPQLNPEKPVNAANYWVQSVVSKSKYQNEAWALINFLAHSKANKEYLDQSGRLTAMRIYITEQKDNPDLEPFISQLLVAESWYKGKNYESAARAITDMAREWLQTPAEPSRILEYRQGILDRAAAKVNQTL